MTPRKSANPVLPAVVWTLVVAVLLAMPGDEIPDPGFWDWLDKPAHAVLFAIHYGLLARALAGRRAAAAAAGSGLFAAIMETIQLWVPGRGWEWWDLVAGFAGIAVVALVQARRRARLPAAS